MFDERVYAASVDVDYFDVLGAPILAGRSFHAADLESGHRVVIVNQSFVERVLQGRNPLGRRVRFANSPDEPGPWYEIVGVARDLGMNYLGSTSGNAGAGLYYPLAPEGYPVHMAVKVRGDPASFAPRLRAVAAGVDARLHLQDLRPLDELYHGVINAAAVLLRVCLLMNSVALLLSLAGIYSVMAFAVSRRTREIGIRVALGVDARRVLLAIFSRPLAQVAVGIVAGGGLVAAMLRYPPMPNMGGRRSALPAGDRAGHRIRGAHDGCVYAGVRGAHPAGTPSGAHGGVEGGRIAWPVWIAVAL